MIYEDPIVKLAGDWLGQIGLGALLIRSFFAVLFAAILGLERANKRHTAGLRTFILVSLSGMIASLLDMILMSGGSVFPAMSAAMMVGVAVLSSNTLLFSSRSKIKGLTTAVALWTIGFIGICLGAGYYTIAVIGFICITVTMDFLQNLEAYLKNKSNHFEIHLELKNKTDLQTFTATIRKLGLVIDDIEANPAYVNSGLYVYTISLTISSKELRSYQSHGEIIEALKSMDCINYIEEIS